MSFFVTPSNEQTKGQANAATCGDLQTLRGEMGPLHGQPLGKMGGWALRDLRTARKAGDKPLGVRRGEGWLAAVGQILI